MLLWVTNGGAGAGRRGLSFPRQGSAFEKEKGRGPWSPDYITNEWGAGMTVTTVLSFELSLYLCNRHHFAWGVHWNFSFRESGPGEQKCFGFVSGSRTFIQVERPVAGGGHLGVRHGWPVWDPAGTGDQPPPSPERAGGQWSGGLVSDFQTTDGWGKTQAVSLLSKEGKQGPGPPWNRLQFKSRWRPRVETGDWVSCRHEICTAFCMCVCVCVLKEYHFISDLQIKAGKISFLKGN